LWHICTQILDYNFLGHIVTDEATFQTSGYVNQHNCVIWGSNFPREHSGHEQDDPKVNTWNALTHYRVISLLLFDEDIIKRHSFPDMLENNVLLQPNKANLILQVDGAPVNFAHIICGCLNFPKLMDRQMRSN
jgi:hypothetical protein